MSLLYHSLSSASMVVLIYSLFILHMYNSYSGVTSALSFCVVSDYQFTALPFCLPGPGVDRGCLYVHLGLPYNVLNLAIFDLEDAGSQEDGK